MQNDNIPKDYIPEIRIGVIGNVDSGKSTTIGVLTHNVKDDGRGYARELVMVHDHEKESGRTSAIAHAYMRFDDKVINLMDLAGHEKYFKTTIHGMCGSLVGRAMLIINANTGISGMTEEHIKLIRSIKVPFYIVYTKIDMTPKNVYDRNMTVIREKFVRKKLKKELVVVTDDTKLDEIINDDGIIPIFPTSNVEGTGIPKLREYIQMIAFNPSVLKNLDKDANVIIDRTYQVPGIGLVLSGIVETGKVSKGDVKMLGPFDGKYHNVRIRNIHNNFREDIDTVYAGQSCCMAVKSESNKFKLERDRIKRGFRLMDKGDCYDRFDAKIMILHHPTTITAKYQPTVNCGTVRETVKILKMNKKELRTGDQAIVTFKFIRHPAYIEVGKRFVFTEGKTKGFGEIISVSNG